jgi:translocation and assembly module TamB
LDIGANDREKISVNLLELEADRAALRGSGLIDFGAQSLEGDFTLRIEDINALQPLVDTKVAGQCVLDGRFLGPFSSPQIELSFSLLQARIADIRAERASGALRIKAFESEVPTFPGFRLSGRGKAEELALVDRSSIDETSIEWSLDAEIPAGQAIQVRNLQISGENVSLSLSGYVDPAESSVQMDTVLQIDEMRRWLGSQPEISGSVHLKAKIEKEGRGAPIFARIEGRSENFTPQSPVLSAFLGGEVTYEALVRLRDSEALNISGLRIDASGAHLTGEASFGLSDQSLAGKWLVTMPEFEGLSPVLGFEVGGSLELAGSVHGHLPELRAAAALTGRGLSIEDIPVDQLKVNLVAEGQPDDMSGLIQIELQEKDRMVVMTSDFQLEGDRLTLPALAFEGPESVGGGNLDVDLARSRVEGALHGQFENLYELSSLLGSEIGGGAEIEVQFVPSHDEQQIILSIDADHLSSPIGETRACNLKMRVMNAFRAPQGNVEMQIRDFQSGGLSVASLGIAAKGNTQEVNIEAHIKGHYAQDFELETQAAIPGFQQIELNEFRGRYGEYLVTLTQPAVVRCLDEGYSLDAPAINLGSGSMRASGWFGEENLTLSVDFKGLPLGAIPSASALGLKASSTGRIQMWGPQDKPEARLEVRLEDLQLSHPFFRGLPQGTLGTEAVLREDTLSARLVLAGWTERPASAELELPVVMSFKPLSITSPPRGELVGQIDVQANLARISRFFHLEDQGLAGLLKVDCSVSGTLDAPVIQARTRIEEGSYENMNTGTILSNVEAELVTRDRRMVIERAMANDGAEGVIRMLGWIDLAPEEDFPFEVELALENAALLRGDDVEAPASGRLKLSGSLADAILNGNFAVQSTEIHIPDRLPEGADLPERIAIQPPEAEHSQ